jgi:hypothetical protein
MEPLQPFAFLEFHDARLRAVAMRDDGTVVVSLTHIAVFERQGPERYDVVSYEAELVADGARNLVCASMTHDRNRVSCVKALGHELAGDRETKLASSPMTVGGLFEIMLTSGSVISFECDSVSLKLGRRGKKLESWSGPL